MGNEEKKRLSLVLAGRLTGYLIDQINPTLARSLFIILEIRRLLSTQQHTYCI